MKMIMLFFTFSFLIIIVSCNGDDKKDKDTTNYYKELGIIEDDSNKTKGNYDRNGFPINKMNELNNLIKNQFTYTPEIAKSIIEKRAIDFSNVLSNKNFDKLLDFIHPLKGLGISFDESTTPFITFSKNDIKQYYYTDKIFIWHGIAGSGSEIKLSIKGYLEKYIFLNFNKITDIGYNKMITWNIKWTGAYTFKLNPNDIFVEYFFPPTELKIDWLGFRVIFEKYENIWYVVSISRSLHEM